jgi:hypothetical protein
MAGRQFSSTSWRIGSASVVGLSHQKQEGGVCQDFCLCDVVLTGDSEVAILLASDGAGSAVRGGEGAMLLCEHFRDLVSETLSRVPERIDSAHVESWLETSQALIRSRAEAAGLLIRDYSCTLLGAVLADNWSALFQIGDGAIVVFAGYEPDAGGDQYNYVFWPLRGEYANTTYFATDPDASANLQFDFLAPPFGRIDEVAILTDGLQMLALHYDTQIAHSPFFRPFFSALRTRPTGFCAAFSDEVERFLSSERINSRTDDDKTLVLATRQRQPDEPLS